MGLESVLHTEGPGSGGGRPGEIRKRSCRLESTSHIAATRGIDHRTCRVDQHQGLDVLMATLATVTVSISQVIHKHHRDASMGQQHSKITYTFVIDRETNCDLGNIGVANEL